MLATGGVILTTAGSLLISRSLELVKPIEFTHMKIGTGDISSIAQARKLNDLVISYKNINMSTLVRSGDLVRVRGSFTNDEIAETVRIKEVGVFAKIGTEQPILFGYVNDGEGELVPPGTSGIVARTRDLYIGITGEAEVAITINKSLVYATIEDLEEGLNRKEDKFLKRSGFNLEKTDLTENDSNKVFTPKGALNLFNTLTTNFTNGINAAKEVLRLDIVKKLNKGAYSGDAQDLKNDIDERVPYYASTKITGIHYNPNSGLHWYINPSTGYVFWDSNNFNPDNKLDRGGLTGTALELKNWLVENYTTLMNNIRENLTNMINTKTPHGGYNKSSQDLKNDIDNKVSLYASAPFLGIHRAADNIHWYLDANRYKMFWDSGNFHPDTKLDKGTFKGDAYDLAYSDNVTPGYIGDTQEAIDKITTPGRYVCGASGGPYHLARLEVKKMLDTNHIMQEIYQWNGPRKFRVAYSSNFVGIPWITTYTEQNFTPANKMDKGGYGGTGLDLYNIATSKVSTAGDRMTGKLEIVTSGGNGVEIIEGVSNNPRITFHNSNTRISLGEHPSHTTDFPLVVMDSNGNNPQRLYHQSFKPTPQEIGAFRLEGVLNAIPKTYSGATQVQNGSPDFAEVGGGSQHFLIQMTTENTYEQNAYVGQIAWGYSPNDPKIAIRCKAPGADGRWEQLVRAKDLANHCPYRIGDIFDTTNAQHPAETYLGTQWERYGDGRVIVGLSESEVEFNVIGKTGGTKTEALTADQNGPHDHPFTTVINGNGWYGQGGNLGPFGAARTGVSGVGAPHNNLQPYIVAYRWRRIA